MFQRTFLKTAGKELCTHVLDFAHLERDFDALMSSDDLDYAMPVRLEGHRLNASPKSGAATAREIKLADLSIEARGAIFHRFFTDLH